MYVLIFFFSHIFRKCFCSPGLFGPGILSHLSTYHAMFPVCLDSGSIPVVTASSLIWTLAISVSPTFPILPRVHQENRNEPKLCKLVGEHTSPEPYLFSFENNTRSQPPVAPHCPHQHKSQTPQPDIWGDLPPSHSHCLPVHPWTSQTRLQITTENAHLEEVQWFFKG